MEYPTPLAWKIRYLDPQLPHNNLMEGSLRGRLFHKLEFSVFLQKIYQKQNIFLCYLDLEPQEITTHEEAGEFPEGKAI